MSGVVCTLAVGAHREFFEFARPTFERFAVRHGRDFVEADRDVAGGRHVGWGKITLLRELVDAYETVVWIDSDAVVVDGRTDVVAGTGARPLSLVWHRYGGLEVPNCGVMVLQSGRWAKRFLERVWRAERYVEHPWWDNAAVLEFLGYDVARPRAATRRRTVDSLRVGALDRAWNSIPEDPAPSPRIRHYPGMPHDRRVELIRAAAASAL